MSDPAASPARAEVNLLIVDDDAGVCWALERMLRTHGFRVVVASSAAAALRVCQRQRVDLVITDVRMPGGSGLDLLEDLRTSHAGLPVVVMTAYGSIDVASSAMARGAVDFLPKPLEMTRTLAVIGRILGRCRMAVEVEPGRSVEPALIGSSRTMQEVFRRIALAASGDLPVLISGPTGVGKELVARLLHRHGRSPASPFVVVDCGAMTANGSERDLFGAGDGRPGLIDRAAGGTIMFDEVGDLPAPVQSALLRVLEELQDRAAGSALGTRIIALNNRDLGAEPGFRRDLLHRLAGFMLTLPALAEHAEDIPLITAHLLGRTATRCGRRLAVTEEAMILLQGYRWPGNVRELRQVLEEAALAAPGGIIDREHLRLAGGADPLVIGADLTAAAGAMVERHPGEAHRLWLEHCELPLYSAALARTSGNQLRAAELLGIHRTTLRRRAQELGLPVGRGDGDDEGGTPSRL